MPPPHEQTTRLNWHEKKEKKERNEKEEKKREKQQTNHSLRTAPTQRKTRLPFAQSRTKMAPQTTQIVKVATITKKLAKAGNQGHEGHIRVRLRVFGNQVFRKWVLFTQVTKGP